MQDISLHLLDIIENSVRAEADIIELCIVIDKQSNFLQIKVTDNGKGMDGEMVANSQNPFFTTKQDRQKKVGLGIPLFKQNAELCDGSFHIVSKPGIGTSIRAIFKLDHIDRMPLGSVADTVLTTIIGHTESDLVFTFRLVSNDGTTEEFQFDTREIKTELDGVPLNHPDVISFLQNFLTEGMTALYREAY